MPQGGDPRWYGPAKIHSDRKTQIVSVYIEPQQVAKIDAIAQEQGISRSGVIRNVIDHYLEIGEAGRE